MNDIQYCLTQDNKHRKSLGNSAKHRVVNKKGRCRLPSDNMTDTQWKKKNGECMTIKLNERRTWKSFKILPPQLQAEYLNHLIDNYGARLIDLAEMFGKERSYLSKYIKEIGGVEFKTRKKEMDERWIQFMEDNVPKVHSDTLADTLEYEPEAPEESVADAVENETSIADNRNPSDGYDNLLVNAIHGNVTFKGDPYAIFAKAIKLFDENKHYTITISFREENEEC